MEVGVTGTTTKTTAACVVALEGSISTNSKSNNSDSCDRRVDAVAGAAATTKIYLQ
jgi:hypothetical protein